MPREARPDSGTKPFSPLTLLLARPLRALFLALVRFFYPRVRVIGAELLPRSGPVMMVANHPNGLLDPVLLQLTAGRPVRFLAKSTFFRNPFGRLAMATFGCIPVFRSQDSGQGADADQDEKRRARNEETFARCRTALRGGAWLALFPEGASHSDPSMRPLKTGAARIALSAVSEAAAAGQNLDVQIVPAGLSYDAKAIFRSGVLVKLGAPIAVAAYAARADERARIDDLTRDIRAALGDVVLEAESRALLAGIAQVAAWTSTGGGQVAASPAQRHDRTRALLDAYRVMSERDPEAVERVTRAARDYARVLEHLGVRDPWALELETVGARAALMTLAKLVVTAPLALIGFLLGWVPYRLAGRVAARLVGREFDILSTVKLLAGSLFLLVAWLIEAVAAGVLLGARAGLVLLALGPITGYAALRFEEIWADAVEAVRYLWLRKARKSQVARLVERRRDLADAVAEALAAGSQRAANPPAAPEVGATLT